MRLVLLILSFLASNSLQNLIIQTKRRYVASIFNGFASHLRLSLLNNPPREQFGDTTVAGRFEVDIQDLVAPDLREAKLNLVNGTYQLQIKCLNLNFKGVWRHVGLNPVMTTRNAFMLNISCINATVGKIVPESYEGVLFIKPDEIDCSIKFGDFSFSITGPQEYSSELNKLLYTIVHEKLIGYSIYDALLAALDSYLKEAAGRLSFRHSLLTGSDLDNFLSATPQVSKSGELLTYHAGTISKAGSRKMPPLPIVVSSPYSIRYYLTSYLVQEVVSDLHNSSMHNQTILEDPDSRLTLTSRASPTVAFENGAVRIGNLMLHIHVKANSSTILDKTFAMYLFLKPSYRKNFQVTFSLLKPVDFSFLSEDLRKKYEGRLKQHMQNFTDSIAIPLPSVENLIIFEGIVTVTKDYIVLEANLASSSPD